MAYLRLMKAALPVFLILLVVGIAPVAGEDRLQEEIDAMIESHPVRFGIFRIQPKLRIGGGYDSNVLSSPDVADPLSDTSFAVAPAGDFAIKLGQRGFFAIEEALNFVYYRDIEALRDIYSATKARLVTGNRRILLQINGGYESRKAPVNYEADAPLQQTSSEGAAKLLFRVQRSTDISFRYALGRAEYETIEDLPPTLPPPPDTRFTEFGAGIEQEVGERIRLIVEGTFGSTDFIDPEVRPGFRPKSDYWNTYGGLEFNSRKITGRARAGFGARESTQEGQDDFRDFLLDTDFDYLFGRRALVGVLLQRRRSTSALLTDNFLVYIQAGVRAEAPIGRRFFVDGRFLIGKNDYGDQPVAGAGDMAITKDNYRLYEAGLNFEFKEDVVLRFGAGYQDRNSDALRLNKDHTTFSIGLILGRE